VAGPLTALGCPSSVGGGLLPEHDSGPPMVLPATTVLPLLLLTVAGPVTVDPASVTPAVFALNVTGPPNESEPHGEVLVPPSSTAPVAPLTDTGALTAVPQTARPPGLLADSGPPSLDPVIETTAPVVMCTGPVTVAWSRHVVPDPMVSGPLWVPVIVVVHPPTVMDSCAVAVICGLLESAACTLKANAPASTGVPEINPVEPASDSPGGNEPDTNDQVYGVVPPVAASVWL
jgi:hypothetical protein